MQSEMQPSIIGLGMQSQISKLCSAEEKEDFEKQ